jgi:hypothetical protein
MLLVALYHRRHFAAFPKAFQPLDSFGLSILDAASPLCSMIDVRGVGNRRLAYLNIVEHGHLRRTLQGTATAGSTKRDTWTESNMAHILLLRPHLAEVN